MPPRASGSGSRSHGGDLNVGSPSSHDGASGDALGKTAVKKSQRPSWSCVECTRRKIKCDKIVPCGQCSKRGKAATCHLQVQDPSLFPSRDPLQSPQEGQTRFATSTEFDAIKSSVSAIRQRLFHLEAVLSNFVPQRGQSGPDGGPLYAYSVQANGQQVVQDERGEYYKAAGEGADEEYGEEVESPRERGNLGLETLEGGPMGGPYGIPGAIERLREEGQMAESDGEVEAAVTLEFLALGRDRKQDHFNRSELRRPADDQDDPSASAARHLSPALAPWATLPGSSVFPPPDAQSVPIDPALPLSPYAHGYGLSDYLPDRAQSDAVVRYSLERVGWQHAAVHGPSFVAECEEFFGWGERRGKLVNQAWLALYYAILCVGVKHMSPHDVQECGMTLDDSKRLPKQYFDASVEALHRSNFLAKHSIYAVQSIVILVVTCQDVGGSDLIATLLACGIRIAQHLNIHRFASDADWENRRRNNGTDPFSEVGIKGLIDREVRKRLWCALATEDWVSIPYRRSYAIFPSHCSTPLPTNCHDEDLSAGRLIVRPMDEPTVVSKIILMKAVASCIRRFFEDINSTGGLSYDLCLQIDGEVKEIISTAPSYLAPNANISHLPPWVGWMAHYWTMAVLHKMLIIHRTFLGRSFKDPRYSYSRKAAIDAARGILQQLTRGSSLPFQHVWTCAYHAIAASTTLILDIFQSSTSDPSEDVINKRLEVQAALEELKTLSDTSPIAARGVQLLSTLLAEEAKHRRTDLSSRKRKAPDPPLDHERFGDVAKRVSNSVVKVVKSPSPRSSIGNSSLPPYYAPQDSPALSDGSLTQDAFDSILLSGIGIGEQQYGPGESPGGVDTNFDFWRMLDASFEPTSQGSQGVGMSFGTESPGAWQ